LRLATQGVRILNLAAVLVRIRNFTAFAQQVTVSASGVDLAFLSTSGMDASVERRARAQDCFNCQTTNDQCASEQIFALEQTTQCVCGRHLCAIEFAAIACLPVILVAVLVVLNLRSAAQANFLDSSGREIRQIDNGMKQFFESIRQNVEYLAKDPRIATVKGLKNYTAANAEQTPVTEADQRLQAIFDRFAETHPTTASISLGLKDGGFAGWPDDPKMASYDPRVRPWYKTAVAAAPGSTVRTSAYYWAPDDMVLVSTVRAFADPSGNPVGVVGVDVSLKQLTELVKTIKLGDSGYLMMVEANGNVLVDPANAKNSFKPLADLGPGYTELAKSGDGVTQVEIDGVPYMVNVVSSESLGWRFIGLIKRDEVMAQATNLTGLTDFSVIPG